MQFSYDMMVGVVFGVICSILFSIQNVIFRSKRDEITPIDANSIKIWVSLVFTVVLAVQPLRAAGFSMPLEAIVPLALSVLLGAAFGDVVYFMSQNRVGVSVAFPIAHSYPIVTYLLAIVFLEEIFLLSRLLGVILTVIGVLLISRSGNTNPPEEEHAPRKRKIVGFGLAIISSFMFALAILLIQVGAAAVDPIDANVVRLSIGSVAMLPLFAFSRRIGTPMPTKNVTKLIVAVSLVASAIGSLLFVGSIKYAGASIAAVITAAAPLFALPMSIIYLKERVTWKGIVGTFVVVVGVTLAILGA